MTTTAEIRRAISDLDREGLSLLAKRTDIRRSDLIDFADIGLSLPDAELARLEAWHEQYRLRRALKDSRLGPILAGMHAATGISDERRNDFIAGNVDFTPEELTKARDYISGRHGMPKAQELPAMTAQPGVPLAEIEERAALMAKLRNLPLTSLKALVQALPA